MDVLSAFCDGSAAQSVDFINLTHWTMNPSVTPIKQGFLRRVLRIFIQYGRKITHFHAQRCVSLRILGESCYVTFALWHEPSVCRLSVVCHSAVTLLHHTCRVELSGSIFTRSNSVVTRTVCVNFLKKKFKRVVGDCAN